MNNWYCEECHKDIPPSNRDNCQYCSDNYCQGCREDHEEGCDLNPDNDVLEDADAD